MISIIIPIYNVEKYLPKCLDSVVNQTYTELEIICINDGSPDNSLKILKEYQKKDSRIKIINQENQGLAEARNTGIDNAKGKFIFFLDSDDWLPLNAIEKLCNKQKEKNADIVIGGRNIVTAKREVQFLPKEYNKTLEFEEYISDSFKTEDFRAVAWGKLYKTKIIKENYLYFPKGLLYEDLLFVMKYLYYSSKIIILRENIYNYRYDRRNSIVNTINKKDMDCLKTVDELEKFFKEKEMENILNKDYYINFIMRWIIYATIGKFCKEKIKYEDFIEYIKLIKRNKTFNEYSKKYLEINPYFIKNFRRRLIYLRNKIYLFGIEKKMMRITYFYILLNRVIIK